jgi:release factor glutamine methyltransferase
MVGEARRIGRELLRPSDTAGLDADLLLGHVMRRPRSWVMAHLDTDVPEDQLSAYRGLLERRRRGEPVGYLRGFVEWHGVDLEVTPDVLIPRPETELLLEVAMKLVRDLDAKVVADVGTGSGAIAIGLALFNPGLEVWAVDISEQALLVAARNLARHGKGDSVRLLQGDLVRPLPVPPDIVVANLPYLSDQMMYDLRPDVRHEPATALHGGSTGLELYEALLGQLRDRGWEIPVLAEIDPRQTMLLGSMVRSILPTWCCVIRPDYAGRDRIAIIWPPCKKL